MKISSLKIAGFRGIRNAIELEVPNGFMVISGRNGSGKSTLCDSIEYALTGDLKKYGQKTETGETIQDYIWWRGPGEIEKKLVEIEFSDNEGNSTTISRDALGSSPSKESELTDLLVDRRTAPESSLEELCETLIIRDEFISDLSLDISERLRFELVKRTIGVSDFGPLEDVATGAIHALDQSLKEHKQRYEQLTKEINEIAVRRNELSSRATADDVLLSAEQLLRENLQDADSGQAEMLERTEDWLIQRRRRLSLIDRVSSRIDELKRAELDHPTAKLQDKLANLQADLATLETKKNVAKIELDKKQSDIDAATQNQSIIGAMADLVSAGSLLGLKEGHCFLCGSEIGEDEYHSHLEKLSQSVEEANSKILELKSEHDSWSNAHSKLSEAHKTLQRQIVEIKTTQEASKRTIQEIRDELREVGIEVSDDIDVLARTVKTEIDQQKQSISTMEDAVDQLRSSNQFSVIDSLENEEKEKRKLILESEKYISALNYAKTRASNVTHTIQRVSGESLDKRLASLSPLLKELYVRLRPHVQWRELEYLVRGDVRRFLSLRVGDNLNPAFMFSSGQRRAAGLAFLLAINLARTWSRLQTLVLDDPIQHVDDYRALHLVELLSAIRRSSRQIVCTIEDNALADLLCRRLRSEDIGDGIRVEMEYKDGYGVCLKSIRKIGPMPKRVLASA